MTHRCDWGQKKNLTSQRILQGKFLSQTVVCLGVFLVGMKPVTAAHQCSNGFHNLWFRRSYICLLYFCLCFTRAEVPHRQYLLWQHDFLTTVLPLLWGRRRQFGITVCCRSRPTAEHESCREKREEQLGNSALGGFSERLELFCHPATLF